MDLLVPDEGIRTMTHEEMNARLKILKSMYPFDKTIVQTGEKKVKQQRLVDIINKYRDNLTMSEDPDQGVDLTEGINEDSDDDDEGYCTMIR